MIAANILVIWIGAALVCGFAALLWFGLLDVLGSVADWWSATGDQKCQTPETWFDTSLIFPNKFKGRPALA